jgi:5'-nucleotidase
MARTLVISNIIHLQTTTTTLPMNILITNDDGIDAPGIAALTTALREIGTVTVVAPDRQQSAVGHALTISRPLRATKVHRDGGVGGTLTTYAVDGTPADCVKLALCVLLDAKPDLVVSGINHGSNTSMSIMYSGTVSAATEAMMLGVPAMAVSIDSLDYATDCTTAARYAARIAAFVPSMVKAGFAADTLLNVNIPALAAGDIRGVRLTHQGTSGWEDDYERRLDPMGREYYWLSGNYHTRDTDLDSDEGALKAGYVSVTPIRYRLTNDDERTTSIMRTALRLA